ncbi:unnamed protein product [Caenorhabditis sp. 36 PRJEB53466]|nr:unnamed protein product [Caenorhabditis sp. 36 PRJEB53466]
MRPKTSFFWGFLCIFGAVCLFALSYSTYYKSNSSVHPNIGIIVVLTNRTDPKDYEVGIKSVECYARAQNYSFLLVDDSDYDCPQRDKFFRRHCVVAKILPRFDAVLFIDADHGVVNPKRRIEEFMDPQFDLIFYDRFFDWEVMAGSYIARNTAFSIQFLTEFADFEEKLPKGAHGSDNGAIHIFLADKIFPGSISVDVCREVYYKAVNTHDVGAYVACIRGVFGSRTDFGNIRIMKKGYGWSRDDWLTSGLWSPTRDFMLHGWKSSHLKEPPIGVLEPIPMNYNEWYNPLAGPIVIGRCFPGNTTWSYNPRLLGDKRKIEESLAETARQVEREKAKSMGRLMNILEKE